MDTQPPSHDPLVERIVLALFALILGAIASWLYWVVHRFDRGPAGAGWIRILSLIVDEFIYAVFLFAAVLLLKAVFAPAWLDRCLHFAYHHLQHAILIISGLFLGGLIFIAVMANLR
jgi:hypothetical protein